MKKVLLFVCFIVMFISCDDRKTSEDTKIERDPRGSIYFDIQIKHSTGVDLLYVTKIVHNEVGGVIRTILSTDSVPTMSLTRDTLDTGRTYVNSDGEDIEIDTIIVHPKNYQLYISVKN